MRKKGHNLKTYLDIKKMRLLWGTGKNQYEHESTKGSSRDTKRQITQRKKVELNQKA